VSFGGVMPDSELSGHGLAVLGARNACDREPIHLSGAIQPHGFLLGVDPVSLAITAASANVPHLVGGATEPLGLALGDVLGLEVARTVGGMKPTGNPHDGLPVRFQLASSSGGQGALTVGMVAHQVGSVLLLEFEEHFPSDSAQAGLHHRMRDLMKALFNADETEDICRTTVQEVRRLTGYDRVMIYRFEPDAHGRVIAEACREEAEPFLGLHYPAEDIPRQARAMYLRNWIRVIGDVDYHPVAIDALADSIPIDQLDLSMSVLRSVSPVHLQYLRNMGVRATMTISLVVDNKLWGMIACHHDSPKLIDPIQRLAFETLGQLVSVRLRTAEVTELKDRVRELGRLASQVVTGMAAGENPAHGAKLASEPLLAMADAGGAVVEIDGTRISAGTVPSAQVIDLVVSRLWELAGAGPGPLVTDALGDLVAFPAGSDTTAACGALFMPLPGRVPGFVLWLRGELAHTVRWAGRAETKPDDDGAAAPAAALTPRASFEEWRETIRGRSTPWGAGEIAAATELAQAMPEVLLHRAQNRLVGLALHDSLTGLPNRTLLNDQLSKLLRTSKPESGERSGDGQPAGAVLFVDLDGFKAVNDTEGHLIGDELLKLAARRISAAVRPQDTVARLGGDEFVVLLPGVDAHTAAGVGQRIVEAFRQSFVAGDEVWRSLTLSVGVAVVAAGTDPGEALRQADSALYHAKRSGRDQVAVYDPDSGTATNRQQLAADELRDAIHSGQIIVHYQPIQDLTIDTTPMLSGFEALARWQHPSNGLVEPALFIRLAEQTGLIDALGEMVLRQALLQLHAWADPRLTMAVNMSIAQLTRPGFAADITSQLTELGIAPDRLCLEITESQMMQQPKQAQTALSELHAAGVNTAIDDFGTGFSSLSYVRDLPATLLKIDRTFVSGLPHSAKDVAVVSATVTLAHSLGIRTVAEGVGAVDQLEHLQKLGSDFAQGDLLGKPAPAQEIRLENWTRDRS
jgi:diguanylate cyclase (GGDEF)-like protein